MGKHLLKFLTAAALAGGPLAGWSPAFHEAQTLKAGKLLPQRMKDFMKPYAGELVAGARGQNNDQVPAVEDVEEQFQRIVKLTEERKRPERIVRELGVLAHQVQLLTDPSAIRGLSPLR